MFISGDLEEFQGENSGGKHTAEFYDYFPELEDAARQYTHEQCSQKLYVRRKTDQTYNTMLKLIIESRENFRERGISMKLLRRFWRCLQAYKDGQTYAEVMQMFFSTKCDGKAQNHTRISNSNLDI